MSEQDDCGELALDYLCDLRVRAAGRNVRLERGLVYASERFLAFDEWPAYVNDAAGNGAIILATIGDAPLVAPMSIADAEKLVIVDGPPREWAARLAIFADPNATRTEAALITHEGRLITWERNGPNGLTICPEMARAPAMAELIERAHRRAEAGMAP